MNYQERLKLVNKDYNKRSVWTSIDRPIRPLVFELARIGMIPKFSCCGFSYLEETEDEPKTHVNGQCYVHFYVKNNETAKDNLMLLNKIVKKFHWILFYYTANILVIAHKPKISDNFYSKIDGISESIHQYESYCIAINALAINIQNNISSESSIVEIIDGNRYYSDIKEWQIKPKNNFKISVENYYKKYGKIKVNKDIENVFEIDNDILRDLSL